MNSLHTFDPDVAEIAGVIPAVIYQNLKYWIWKNAASDENCHEGKVWTFNSIKSFKLLFPYLSEKQIRSALDHLEEVGLVGSNNFNKSAYDRTKWYCLLRQKDLPIWANGSAPEGEPIPNVNTDITTDSKPDAPDGADLFSAMEEPQSKEPDRFDEFWKAFPKKAGKPAALKAWQKAVRKTDPGKIIAAARVYAGTEAVLKGFIKFPQGWLNEERFNDPDLQPAPAAVVQRWAPGGYVR